MSKYNILDNLEDIEQRLCNVISYVLYLYDKKIISERTRNEILKICNPDVYKGSDYDGRRTKSNM